MVTPMVENALNRTGIAFEVLRCDPEFADTAAFVTRYGLPLEISANTIVVTSRRGPPVQAAAVVLATTRLDVNGTMRRLMGCSKASFASADETRSLTGMEIGGVTAVGLPAGLPLYIDAAVMGVERIVLGGGDRSSKLLVSPSLLTAVGGTVVEGLAR
ncbi:MAG: YbaK/EbsC family protein [Candidatus Dormibacteria bacterium]